jgi:hypothetical protein
MKRALANGQTGAALAVSLIILVILTLLGIAAMRASRLELRLSQNAESRMLALESAQAIADATINDTVDNLRISDGPGYVACFFGSGDTAPANPTFSASSTTDCGGNTTVLNSLLAPFAYLQTKREDPEFSTVNMLRGAGASGRSYDFARFTVTAGYDNSANGQGAAEVVQGTLKLHAKPQGVNYQ